MPRQDLAQALHAAFSHHADRLCLRIDGREHSYREVLGRAVALAHAMNARDAGSAPIAVLGNHSLAAYCAVLAALLSGRPYVPVNAKFPPGRQAAIAVRSHSRFLLADEQSTSHAAPLLAAAPGLEPLALPSPDDAAPIPLLPRPSLIAYIMFTSGTTGEPKGVMVTTDNLVTYARAFAELATIKPDDRCTQLFDLSFDLSVHDIFVTFLSGAALVVGGERDAIDPVGFAAREGVTCWFSVPSVATMAKRFRRLRPGALPTLRLALFCGEALSTALARDWLAAAPNARTLNVYGPTEATIAITAYDVAAATLPDEPVVPLGWPYPHAELVVVDPDLALVDDGAIGELLLGGPQVTAGYLDNPATTAEKFVDRTFPGYRSTRWYRSGDLGTLDPTHGFLYRGRIDDQVKIRGFRVEIAEVEECARRGIDGEVAIVALPAPGNADEQVLAAGLVGDVTVPALVDHCRAALPDYMVPTEFVTLDALPLNANGKVDRKAVRQTLLQARQRSRITPP